MAERFCRVCGNWHDLERPWPSRCLPHIESARSDLPFPAVMSDTMDPVQSMASGKFYTSKRAMRAEYKAMGLVEVGNDPARHKRFKKPKANEKAIRESVEKAAARFARGERASH
jgi:hypothetical protein